VLWVRAADAAAEICLSTPGATFVRECTRPQPIAELHRWRCIVSYDATVTATPNARASRGEWHLLSVADTAARAETRLVCPSGSCLHSARSATSRAVLLQGSGVRNIQAVHVLQVPLTTPWLDQHSSSVMPVLSPLDNAR